MMVAKKKIAFLMLLTFCSYSWNRFLVMQQTIVYQQEVAKPLILILLVI